MHTSQYLYFNKCIKICKKYLFYTTIHTCLHTEVLDLIEQIKINTIVRIHSAIAEILFNLENVLFY